MGSGVGAGSGPGMLLGTEVAATLLLLCWLCCWPDDSNSDSSSTAENPGRYPKKPVLVESKSRKRSSEMFSRRMASSAVSLHLPSTSGYTKQALAAHRSHEEIRSRRKSHHETTDTPETRYYSAPSVIDEVIHRRDWERSTKDLYIPLNPEKVIKLRSISTPSIEVAPHSEPESSSIECLRPEEHHSSKLCKKHYTNIKSSKGKKCKESNKDDIKDTDATEVEVSNFYIGDHHDTSPIRASTSNDEDLVYNAVSNFDSEPHRDRDIVFGKDSPFLRASASNCEDFVEYERLSEERSKTVYKAKEAKQSLNESIRLKELPRKGLAPLAEGEVRAFELDPQLMIDDDLEPIDRSGAVHHTIESRISLRQYPPPSVETVGYEGGSCYLAEVGSVSELRARAAASMSPHAHAAALGALQELQMRPALCLRARHASDGDILAPPHRPESGAFSESDLDLDADSEERPPDYDEVQLYAQEKKETAI